MFEPTAHNRGMRIIAAVLIAFLLALQYAVWLGDFGYVRLQRLHAAISSQENVNQQLAQRNRRLQAEVVDLKKGTAALEERARTQLGMIKQGEIFYQVLEKDR